MIARSNDARALNPSFCDTGLPADRKELRYSFARLLLQGSFVQAKGRAILAYSQGRITKSDLDFVIWVVETAGKTEKKGGEEVPTTPPGRGEAAPQAKIKSPV